MPLIRRFRQEAHTVASLDHLHILPLYRYGEEETVGGQRAFLDLQVPGRLKVYHLHGGASGLVDKTIIVWNV